jgi:S1-C subfamily serine protease
MLFAVWLVASGLSNVQSYNIGRSIHESALIGALDNALPTPPDFIAQLEKVISPNGFPKVFVGNEPEHTTVTANPAVDNAVVARAEKSVVRVEGKGCGGIIEGSGFVADKGIVVTNAHVIAGVQRPMVVDSSGIYPATPIWFDPNKDIAILRVGNLNDPALPLSADRLRRESSTVVLGFPGGGSLVAKKGVVIDQVRAVGRNIYNRGLVARDIYELQADVEPGNSGGPVIEADGAVAAVVFAKGVSQQDIGYALTIDEVKPILNQARSNQAPVGVGSCAAS